MKQIKKENNQKNTDKEWKDFYKNVLLPMYDRINKGK